MTDANPKTSFDLKYFFVGDGVKDWYKALGNGWRLLVIFILVIILTVGVVRVVNFIFPKQKQNISQPRVVAFPGSTVGDVDMRSIQVSVEEKPWEIGVGAAALNFDNKNGAIVGAIIKRKF